MNESQILDCFPSAGKVKGGYSKARNQLCPAEVTALFYHLIISWLRASLCARQRGRETLLTVEKMLLFKRQQIRIEARLFLPDKNMKLGK